MQNNIGIPNINDCDERTKNLNNPIVFGNTSLCTYSKPWLRSQKYKTGIYTDRPSTYKYNCIVQALRHSE